MRRNSLALNVLVSLCIGAAIASAQEITGSIVGTVTDSSGAAVAGAKITIKSLDKNVVLRTVTTEPNGQYLAAYLPVGSYEVVAEAPNLKKSVYSKIALNVADKLTINLTLEVGSVSETVAVEANPLQVELQSVTAAGLVNPIEVRELPLNARNYEQLVTLMPGASYSSGSDTLYIGNSLPSGTTNVVPFSFNGLRNSANNWTIDGADNVDRGSNQTVLNYPSVDAIEEFKVLRGQYDPEFGRAAAAQINVVTKTGGSSFHGDAYEFFRNNVLQANNFFNNASGIKRPPLRWNDFGYTIGGPAYIPGRYNTGKDRTFFFFSQEIRRVITYGTVNASVPTAAMKTGTFADPVCTTFNSAGACTATGTTISNISPVAAAYIKDIWSTVSPPNSGPSTLFVPLRNVFNANQQFVRIDHIFGPRLSVFGHYLHDGIPTVEPVGLFQGVSLPLPNVATTNTNSPGRNLAIHTITTINPQMVNEAGFQYSYGAILSKPVGLDASANSPDVKPTLPFPVTLGRIPSVSVSGLSGVAGFGPYNDYNRDYNAFTNQSWARGPHAFKFGLSYHHYQKTENAAGNNVGSFSVTTVGQPTTTGATTAERGWANFLLGRVATFSQASVDITPDIRTNQFEMYAQDDYRLRKNLTVSFGVRYSIFREPTDAKRFLTNFVPSVFDSTHAPTIDSNGNICTVAPCAGGGTPNPNYNSLNGVAVNGAGGVSIQCVQCTVSSPFGVKVSNEDKKNFAPRIGFAWDPFSKGNTSIRGGYGIFYDATLFGIVEQNIFQNPPFVQSVAIVNTTLDNPTGGTSSVSLSPRALRATPSPFHSPYVQEWSLDVQRNFWHGVMLDVGYYGSKGTHLIGIADINQPAVGAYVAAGLSTMVGSNITVGSGGVQNENLLNQIRPYKGYGPINAIQSRYNSNYNSLQVAVQKRFQRHSLLNIYYTYSKALTDNQTDRSSAPQNVYDIHADYGPLQQDRTHIFTADAVYALPWFESQEGAVGHLLGGWQISGIISVDSGLPLTVFTFNSFDPAGQGVQLASSTVSIRPDEIANPNSGAPHTVIRWFNTAAFVDVPGALARPGNEGRGVVRGPGYQKWDVALEKYIKVKETANFEFRAEAFNIFNHTNFFGVGTTLGSGAYGTITSTRDPRALQLGLKLNF